MRACVRACVRVPVWWFTGCMHSLQGIVHHGGASGAERAPHSAGVYACGVARPGEQVDERIRAGAVAGPRRRRHDFVPRVCEDNHWVSAVAGGRRCVAVVTPPSAFTLHRRLCSLKKGATRQDLTLVSNRMSAALREVNQEMHDTRKEMHALVAEIRDMIAHKHTTSAIKVTTAAVVCVCAPFVPHKFSLTLAGSPLHLLPGPCRCAACTSSRVRSRTQAPASVPVQAPVPVSLPVPVLVPALVPALERVRQMQTTQACRRLLRHLRQPLPTYTLLKNDATAVCGGHPYTKMNWGIHFVGSLSHTHNKKSKPKNTQGQVHAHTWVCVCCRGLLLMLRPTSTA